MTLKVTVQISGLDSLIEGLKSWSEGDFSGQYVYPVYIGEIDTDLTMQELTEVLIALSVGDYVAEAITSLKDFTNESFQARIFEVLEGWGQNPTLSDRALSNRKKAGVGATPRNVITGDYVRCFGLGFSENLPMDIPIQWVRKL